MSAAHRLTLPQLRADIDRGRDRMLEVLERMPGHLEQQQEAVIDGIRGADAAMTWLRAQEARARAGVAPKRRRAASAKPKQPPVALKDPDGEWRRYGEWLAERNTQMRAELDADKERSLQVREHLCDVQMRTFTTLTNSMMKVVDRMCELKGRVRELEAQLAQRDQELGELRWREE